MPNTSQTNTPSLSVIIPVFNGGESFRRCLETVFNSELRNFEVIVVDDGSTDSSADVARSFPCSLILSIVNSGPSVARNIGAANARSGLLFFLDADILIQPESLEIAVSALQSNQQIDALFGSYTKETIPGNLVSRYKNYVHHYTHQNSNADAVTFCGGFGAIRRPVFITLGGFDPDRRILEDIELGHRLHLNGHSIRLVKTLLTTHCKRYDLFSLIRSDLVGRAIPWTRLILETGVVKNDLNLRVNNVMSVAVSYLILLLPAATCMWKISWAIVVLVALMITFVALNRKFLLFLRKETNLTFSIASTLLCWLSSLYSGLGALIGGAQHFVVRHLKVQSDPGEV